MAKWNENSKVTILVRDQLKQTRQEIVVPIWRLGIMLDKLSNGYLPNGTPLPEGWTYCVPAGGAK